MKKTHIVAIVVAAALVIGGWNSIPRRGEASTRWEYTTANLTTFIPTDAEYVKQLSEDKEAMKIATDAEKKSRDEYQAKMKQLGLDGWELVSIVNSSTPMFEFLNVHQQEAFFKRPLP